MPPQNAIPSYRSTHINSATTTAVKTGTGTLHRIIVGTTAAGTITVNDGLGTKLVLGASYPVGSHEMNIECTGKVEVVTGAASDITVAWS